MKFAHKPESSSSVPRDPRLRRSFLRNLFILLLVTIGAISVVMITGANRSVDRLSRTLVAQSTEQTKTRLNTFFRRVHEQLLTASEWGRRGIAGLDVTNKLDEIFQPLIANMPEVSSMMIADTEGREYMLLRQEDSWLSRRLDLEGNGNEARWIELNKNGELVQEWSSKLDYDPRVRPWYTLAMNSQEAKVNWTDPYTFFTTKDPGITASIRWQSPRDGKTYVTAFDVLLLDVTRFTAAMEVSPNGFVSVLTNDGKVLGLPGVGPYREPDTWKASVLKPVSALSVPALADVLDAWQKNDMTQVPFNFTSLGDSWWGGIHDLTDKERSRARIAVIVPESDLLGDARQQRNATIVITIAALVVGFFMAVMLDRRYRRSLVEAVREARQLGQYKLVRKIGEGGMGVVYEASHSMLRRRTAVKLLHPERARSDDDLQRFEREVRLTSRLTHLNTVAIYDYGHTDEGIFYYAMEYLDGMSLEQLVKVEGKVSAPRTIHILEQICRSLAEAHGIGLIHRDIKPANIILSERGGVRDVVKVVDFGLVKELHPEQDASVTSPGTILGTPHYMSPESIQSPQDVDGRSDLYAVAGIGYYLLAGRHIFPGESMVEVCYHHLHTVPEPPSTVADAAVPEDLENLILRCLEKDPGQRPASAEELCALLESCQDSGKWTREDAERWWRDHDASRADREATAEEPSSHSAATASMSVVLPRRDMKGSESG